MKTVPFAMPACFAIFSIVIRSNLSDSKSFSAAEIISSVFSFFCSSETALLKFLAMRRIKMTGGH